MSPGELVTALKTDPQKGLTQEEAKKRLSQFGANVWATEKRTSPVLMFLSQFVDPIVLILIAALVVSGVVLQEWIDAAAIGVILMLNAVLGFVQEYRADKALSALKKLSAPRCNVRRGGLIFDIDTEELVPGDLVVLQAGDKIPADGRLVDAKHILVDESSLTGESVPVDKQIEALDHDTRLAGEKRNMAFLGTTVVKGRGEFLVTGTGTDTEMGKVAQSLSEKRDQTPLQKDLAKLGTRILIIVLATCAIVFLVELFKQGKSGNWIDPLLRSISLAVAAIPEGLAAAVTISLALGLRRMAKNRAIVRRLHAVETLGATTYICSDKTGTLTENKMRVEEVIPANKGEEKLLLKTMILCNDTQRSGEGLTGDPTETALTSFAEANGFDMDEIKTAYPRVDEIAFDSDRKMMTTLHRWDSGFVSATKGAPEQIIERSANLDSKKKEDWLLRCNQLSQQGFRLLGFAYKRVKRSTVDAGLEQDMDFLGIVAESDPPRAEVPAAIEECKQAGIRVAMITGDHMATARAVASKIGIEGDVITGEELAEMTDEELHDRVQNLGVYARVSPLQKVKILEALKYHDHVVAMTGDGVNDAPALKKADIGVAMGITGTDVSVEASQMVLTDDNFTSIVAAVREGRLIFENIKKFVHFLLSCNVSEVLTIFVSSILGMPIPLFPIQILWVNLVTDGLPALALGSDKATGNLMDTPPRSAKQNIITQMGLLGIIGQGLMLTIGVLGAYALALYVLPKIPQWLELIPYWPAWVQELVDAGERSAQLVRIEALASTIAFSTLVFSQLLHAFNFRVGKFFLFSRETFRNMFLNFAFLLSLGLQAAVIYFSPAAMIFKSVPLNWIHLLVILGASFIPVITINLLRGVIRK